MFLLIPAAICRGVLGPASNGKERWAREGREVGACGLESKVVVIPVLKAKG